MSNIDRYTFEFEIVTWIDNAAPVDSRWCACIGEYDLDKHVARAAHQADAMRQLIDFHEQLNGRVA